jgi:hypothetical protein
VVSRFLVIGPLFALLRLDARTAGVVAVNLAQISEFSLVIVALGAGLGHVSADVSSVVIYTLLITSVLSTYGILYSHELASLLARAAGRLGFPVYAGAAQTAAPPPGDGHAGADVFFLGVSREGLAFLQLLERESPEMKRRIVAVDYNPETLEALQADGVACHYGDIGNVETLRHAGIQNARIVVSSISDWFLKGITNQSLVRIVRGLAPDARIIATADRLADAKTLYEEGASFVLIPPALAAERLYRLLSDFSEAAVDAARADQSAELFGRASRA